MRVRLRTRVAVTFAALSLLVAGSLSASTYAFASWYLLDQREKSALTRAALDARALDAALQSGAAPIDALAQIPNVGTSQSLLRLADTWYTVAVTVPPDALPDSLLSPENGAGAQQRFGVADDPYFGVALPTPSGLYVEVFPLRELDRTLTWGGWTLLALTLLAGLLGAAIGASAVGRLLGPVRRLGQGASRIADGDLSTRIALTSDPDLDPIAESFNEMAEAVQDRIARERRFSANVSHELRSPLTAVLGTAELLEARSDRLPDREASLIGVLGERVRRLSQMLLDLLEISRIGTEDAPQWEFADITALCRDVLTQRGLDESIVIGDEPVLRTDTRRLERIVGNLVDNAERHGGGVTRIVIERDDTTLRIAVDDDGPGIDETLRARMFEPFVRGDAASGAGAGLGLAIVQEQTHMLGGDVFAAPNPQGGSRFTVLLPIVTENP